MIAGFGTGRDGGGMKPTGEVSLPFGMGMRGGGGIAFLVFPRPSPSSKGFFILAVALLLDLFSSLAISGAVTSNAGRVFSRSLLLVSGSVAFWSSSCWAGGCNG